MCGIAGRVDFSERQCNQNPLSDIVQMLSTMGQRGPDQSGIWMDRRAKLGCRRLAVQGGESGGQPMTTPDGRFTIVYNGECYDLAALRGRLTSAGVSFRTTTDTEVILHSYARYGADCLQHFNGMFAFAIWDRIKSELFLARDRFGIKPLYYSQVGETILFASSLDAIRSASGFPDDIDPVAVRQYLETRFIPAPRTIYRHAQKLEPGHFLKTGLSERQHVQWWDLPTTLPLSQTDTDYPTSVTNLERLLRQSVDRRLCSDRPLGLAMSGGIDSGLLADILAKRSIPAFHLSTPGDQSGESKRATLTADSAGIDFRTLSCPTDVNGLFEEVVSSLDEPMADSSAMMMMALSNAIKENVTVLFTGSGADEVFAGYHRQQFVRWASSLKGIPLASRSSRFLGRTLPSGRVARALQSFCSDPVSSFYHLTATTAPHIYRSLVCADFLRNNDADSASAVFRQHFDAARDLPLLQRLNYLDIKTILSDAYLVKEDRMTMARSIETRVPFLDHHLVDNAFRLPQHFKQRFFGTKRILRTIASRHLPPNVARARKRGFEAPAAKWLRNSLSQRLKDSLLGHEAAIFEYCNRKTVRNLVEQHLQGTDHSRLIYTLLLLEEWLSKSAARNGRQSTARTTFKCSDTGHPRKLSMRDQFKIVWHEGSVP